MLKNFLTTNKGTKQDMLKHHLKTFWIFIFALFAFSGIAQAVPPTLTNGSVNPTAGTGATTFIYQVTYTDLDGDDPTIFARVIIDGVNRNMVKISGTSQTGAVYQYATTLAIAVHRYQFSFRNPLSPAVTTPLVNNQPTIADTPPTLTGGSVNPTTGGRTTTYTYEVTYTDIDNDAPTVAQVIIDGTARNMTRITATYATGALYRYTRTGAQLTIGNHNYQYSFQNARITSPVSTSLVNEPSVTDNEPTLTGGSVSPISASLGTNFTYEVTYTDTDGDAPTVARIIVDGTARNMTRITATYATGALYRYMRTGTQLGLGNHNYKFLFTNAYASAETTLMSGPTVTDSAPTLSGGLVNPTSGSLSKTFTYEVTYTDTDGTAPSSAQIIVDGTARNMTRITTTYATGALYRYIRTGTQLGLGNHNYKFLFTNAYASAETTLMSGPTVTDSAPTLTGGSVNPTSGSVNNTYDYRVTYTDADGDDPTTFARVVIDGVNRSMIKISGTAQTGAIYQYLTTLAIGAHRYQFSFRNPYAAAVTTPLVNNQPVVAADNPPTLSSPTVSPNPGSQGRTFYFYVTYRDADDDAPTIRKAVTIDGGGDNDMTYMSGSVQSGAVYRFGTSSLAEGNHTYQFFFQNAYGAASTAINNGPTVTPWQSVICY